MTTDAELIQQLWKEEKLPCIYYGVIFGNGEVVEIKFTGSENFPDVQWAEEKSRSSLRDYLKAWDGGLCSIWEFGRLRTDNTGYPNYAVVFGGSDYEGDGYIGLVDTETGKLIWMLRLFIGSIIMGQYFEGVVYGFTEEGDILHIPVEDPLGMLFYESNMMRKFMHFWVKRDRGEL